MQSFAKVPSRAVESRPQLGSFSQDFATRKEREQHLFSLPIIVEVEEERKHGSDS
jgi:hypothetical protein